MASKLPIVANLLAEMPIGTVVAIGDGIATKLGRDAYRLHRTDRPVSFLAACIRLSGGQ